MSAFLALLAAISLPAPLGSPTRAGTGDLTTLFFPPPTCAVADQLTTSIDAAEDAHGEVYTFTVSRLPPGYRWGRRPIVQGGEILRANRRRTRAVHLRPDSPTGDRRELFLYLPVRCAEGEGVVYVRARWTLKRPPTAADLRVGDYRSAG